VFLFNIGKKITPFFHHLIIEMFIKFAMAVNTYSNMVTSVYYKILMGDIPNVCLDLKNLSKLGSPSKQKTPLPVRCLQKL